MAWPHRQAPCTPSECPFLQSCKADRSVLPQEPAELTAPCFSAAVVVQRERAGRGLHFDVQRLALKKPATGTHRAKTRAVSIQGRRLSSTEARDSTGITAEDCMMTRLIVLLLSSLLPALGCSREAHVQEPAAGVETDEAVQTSASAPSETPAPAPNVVQAEMQMLTTVMEDAVRAVGNGDVSQIGRALHALHAAKASTEAAVKNGSYAPPRNGDRISTFLAMDDDFHDLLRAMVAASRTNDVPAMAQAVGETIKACHSCHALFRDP